MQFAAELRQPFLSLFDLGFGEFAHFRITGHSLRSLDVGLAGLVGVIQLHDRFEFGAFAVQLAERIHVPGGFFGAQ